LHWQAPSQQEKNMIRSILLAMLGAVALGLSAGHTNAQATVSEVFVKQAPVPAPDKPSVDIQVRYRALLAMQDALADSAKDIDANNQMLNKYLDEQKFTAGYEANFVKMKHKVEDEIPISFNEALGITLSDVQANPARYADYNVPEKMNENQYQAQRAMVVDKWNELMPQLMRAGAKAYYIESQGKWDAFLGWLDVQAETQKREYDAQMAKRKAEVAAQAQKDYDASKKRMFELAEQRKKEQNARMQQQWDNRMAEYNAVTNRVIANRSRFYSYGYWRDARWRRTVGGYYY
jgi:hypothetical protein